MADPGGCCSDLQADGEVTSCRVENSAELLQGRQRSVSVNYVYVFGFFYITLLSLLTFLVLKFGCFLQTKNPLQLN